MPLDPRFIGELSVVMSNPAYMCDISLRLLRPDIAELFGAWQNNYVKFRRQPPNFEDVYNWLHEQFEDSPELDKTKNPDWHFLEMFKCITSTAYGIPYKAPNRIILNG